MGMEWALAAVFFGTGLVDMGTNYCGTENGCLGKSEAQEALSLSFGQAMIDENSAGTEFYARYEFNHKFGPFQPSLGVSTTTNGDSWIGFGNTWTHDFKNDWTYLRLSSLVGLYEQGSAEYLGSSVQFRSSVELGVKFKNGGRLGLSVDHRSNADLWLPNPGMETYQIRYSMPL